MKTTRYRDGELMVTVQVHLENAKIDFKSILDACEVKPDEEFRRPWEDGNGWEHDKVDATHDDQEHAFNFVRPNRGKNFLLRFKAEAGLPSYEDYRKLGASKQVARELEAQAVRENMKTLVGWYENGWEYFGIVCDFKGAHDSCWGYLGYEADDIEGLKVEHAMNVAHELEKQGYEVENCPKPKARTFDTLAAIRERMSRLVVKGRNNE